MNCPDSVCNSQAGRRPALEEGCFVRIKCLYTDEERREALVGEHNPQWVNGMDAAMGKIGVVVDGGFTSAIVAFVGNNGVRAMRAFDAGWLIVVRDASLEVPRDTAAALGYPLPASNTDQRRARINEAIDALESDIAALRATVNGGDP